MVKQDRAVRTRQAILAAAAKVFEDRGYQAATITEILATANVTKGALYFHFESKEHLAQGVLAEQDQRLVVPARHSKVQEVVDTVALHAHRLQTDPMVRAGVRLSLDQQATELDRSGPFLRWSEIVLGLLEEARGELLPHVVPSETADVLVGSFAGVQAMSQIISGYQDLDRRVSQLLRHILPNVVLASVLATVDLSAGRGAAVYEEASRAATAPERAVLTAG
ncbi:MULTISPECIES: ScbR family autoregulator-binding transcription factor [Streptomyces]|uniref:TetR/AcrR family transcriptional regulator n=1 Tax=Streptomyces apricus TaxID=1828112 RepID=A0A5A9YX29_9ACTN|nr:ScbR family autoregulator-binding transcription factor [Streptomyces apricus]KAA0909450.1 TetR/AcrR family transcriptional regulator [Streptomyces apricus]